jgi:diaminopimelate decarboxylase
MHHFKYVKDELYCENVPVSKIAEHAGTPFYLYSHATLQRHFSAFDRAFEGVDHLICFSAKANSSLAILKMLSDLGSGLDIVSGGELYRGLKAGFDPGKVVYSGVGKRVDEIDYALEQGIRMFNVESMQELEVIDQRAGTLGKTASIAIRVNPDVDPKTHPYISTGLKKNKFGIDTHSAIAAYQIADRMQNVRVEGIDCHIGSQISEAEPFKDALQNLMMLVDELKRLGIAIHTLDMGGGLGITYDRERPPEPGEYARPIVDTIKERNLKVILEPGRVIVGNAGILVTRVLYRKSVSVKEFIIADAGMNDLMRPSLYGAYHAVQPVRKSSRAQVKADLVGPICESGDFLASDREMADVERGELMAVMSAGAYCYTMSSNYCSRLKVPEVMVKGDRFEIIRDRQNYADLVEGESIPSFL